MDRHKQTVHGLTITKQFKCDFEGCGRIFKDRPSFYTHSLIHKDRSLVYKHKCTVDGCDSVFKRRRNLSIHMIKHGTNRRRYTCAFSHCKRTYTRERELSRHIEIAHRGKCFSLWWFSPLTTNNRPIFSLYIRSRSRWLIAAHYKARIWGRNSWIGKCTKHL